MKPVKVRQVAAAVGGELAQGDGEVEVTGVSTDTRTIRPGDLFFALVGENGDGHEYAATAVEKGAAAAVVSRQVDTAGSLVRVSDALVALGDLAAWYRRLFDVRVVAITGSVGKTTAKEMIAAVLGTTFRTLKNSGNFNNEIGVPLTILELNSEHEILIQEMAMRLPGEIARLAEIAGPDIAVITNIGVSHIERLGSRDAIAAAKAELLEALPFDGLAVLNADDPYLDFLSSRYSANRVTFGISGGDVRAEDISLDSQGRPSFTAVVGQTRFDVALPVSGEHNVANALAAVAVGLCFGLPVERIAEALSEVSLPEKRVNIFEARGGWKVFDDTYNANPDSMASALRTLSVMEGRRKIAILGDMLELGDYAERAHREVGRIAAESGLFKLITVGELGLMIGEGARNGGFTGEIEHYDSSEAAGVAIKGFVRFGDVILVKGSRGMKMEKVVEALK
ncbi:MAG: UDP-N-acetylmuramoyl-tripeptide--D-alanyl-D-alanine ligase [Armatimonadetes bacterium]|nr:UDP-N-acetylmuramoyl-tripeptide--D-alanyl-D-alanine ligase [Armatimonadota bacterium]